MSAFTSSLRQYSLAAVVALGLAAAWLVLTAWLVGMLQASALQNEVYEQPYFRLDGEAVIMRYPRGMRSSETEVVDSSGQVTKANTSELIATEYVSPRSRDWVLVVGTSWDVRLAGVNDGGSPATYWYLVHDGRAGGSAYGVGYHAVTRRLAGYFGRQGFTSTLPSRADWFTVEGDSGLSQVTLPITSGEPYWSSEHVLHLLANGKLWSIDARQKRVRALADAPSGATLGRIWDLRKPASEQRPPEGAVQGMAWAPRTLVVRSDDACLLVDPEAGLRAKIPLPAELRGQQFAACELPGDNLVVVTSGASSEHETVAWLDPQGQIVKRQERHLTRSGAYFGGEAGLPWMSLLAAPFPAGQAPTVLLMQTQLVATGAADSYAAAFLPSLIRFWPALLGSALIGAISAVAAYRRQRRFALSGAIDWAIFAFLFGAPGWIAYRFHRTWPVVEHCPACEQPSPRDREVCTECGATFPPPPLKGTEVFA